MMDQSLWLVEIADGDYVFLDDCLCESLDIIPEDYSEDLIIDEDDYVH